MTWRLDRSAVEVAAAGKSAGAEQHAGATRSEAVIPVPSQASTIGSPKCALSASSWTGSGRLSAG